MTLFFLKIIYFLRFRDYNEKKLLRQIKHAQRCIQAIGVIYCNDKPFSTITGTGVAKDIHKRKKELDKCLRRHEIRLMIAQKILSKIPGHSPKFATA